MGDFNARIQKALNQHETEIVGKHTFDKNFQNVHEQSNEVAEKVANKLFDLGYNNFDIEVSV